MQILATEVFKVNNDLSPEIMKEVELKDPSSSLRSQRNYFVRGNVKATHYGIQSIKYLARNIWDLVLNKKNQNIMNHSPNLKTSSSLDYQVTVLVSYAKNIWHKKASFDQT